MMTQVRGSSNAKAKAELDWVPRYPSWRQGFAAEFSQAAVPAPVDRPRPPVGPLVGPRSPSGGAPMTRGWRAYGHRSVRSAAVYGPTRDRS